MPIGKRPDILPGVLVEAFPDALIAVSPAGEVLFWNRGAEDLGRLFVEFQQLDASSAKKYADTGLGLALTRRIVEAQGGHVVGVRSTPGHGSTFFAVLPRADGPKPIELERRARKPRKDRSRGE